jgi:hypothetical protein
MMFSVSEGATKGVNANNLSRTPDVTHKHARTAPTTPQTPPHFDGQTTPPSPFTDATSYSALALSSAFAVSAAGTPHTDLTSLPSDVSKLSLGLAAKKPSSPPPGPPPAAVSWPYSRSAALDDIPGIAYALETFLKSQMMESEEYCHRNDPKKCVFRCDRLMPRPARHSCLGLYRLKHSSFFFRERLYFAAGFGLIQCVKALMSYEDDVRLLTTILTTFGCFSSSYL